MTAELSPRVLHAVRSKRYGLYRDPKDGELVLVVDDPAFMRVARYLPQCRGWRAIAAGTWDFIAAVVYDQRVKVWAP